MSDRCFRYPLAAALALLLLRLALGVHFFNAGVEKLSGFSSEGFLLAAKGPMALTYQSFAAGEHDWRALLSAPRQLPADAEAGPAHGDWSHRVKTDWTQMRDDFVASAELSEEQTKRAEEIVKKSFGQLDAYLAGVEDAISEYRYELWKLAELKQSPAAGELPYVNDRIADATSSTRNTPRPWVNEVAAIETQMVNQLRVIAAPTPAIDAALDPAIPLDSVNTVVTWTVLSVGVMLFIGLATPVAALVAALFLLSVMASQPPWVAGAEASFFYYQLVEVAALLAVAATGAGKWAGLDGVFRSLCSGCCRKAPDA
ncbi:hypothetical protein Pla175_21620 [Pirellulimonas nuda]|uniref:DoxX n=1 Tax=Pirellulimonas nuda TaxID=2528009 RepID=A0A518DBC2_9BACT|nr:hypothetical protein [Pirellulimonas nuda]QDU88779.1 hypothetical protein Pla175_21620 [Pirellulimonas nuda]